MVLAGAKDWDLPLLLDAQKESLSGLVEDSAAGLAVVLAHG
jgi:hypothetical protein